MSSSYSTSAWVEIPIDDSSVNTLLMINNNSVLPDSKILLFISDDGTEPSISVTSGTSGYLEITGANIFKYPLPPNNRVWYREIDGARCSYTQASISAASNFDIPTSITDYPLSTGAKQSVTVPKGATITIQNKSTEESVEYTIIGSDNGKFRLSPWQITFHTFVKDETIEIENTSTNSTVVTVMITQSFSGTSLSPENQAKLDEAIAKSDAIISATLLTPEDLKRVETMTYLEQWSKPSTAVVFDTNNYKFGFKLDTGKNNHRTIADGDIVELSTIFELDSKEYPAFCIVRVGSSPEILYSNFSYLPFDTNKSSNENDVTSISIYKDVKPLSSGDSENRIYVTISLDSTSRYIVKRGAIKVQYLNPDVVESSELNSWTTTQPTTTLYGRYIDNIYNYNNDKLVYVSQNEITNKFRNLFRSKYPTLTNNDVVYYNFTGIATLSPNKIQFSDGYIELDSSDTFLTIIINNPPSPNFYPEAIEAYTDSTSSSIGYSVSLNLSNVSESVEKISNGFKFKLFNSRVFSKNIALNRINEFMNKSGIKVKLIGGDV